MFTASDVDTVVIATIALSALIGTVTFFGSLVASAKLQGVIRSAPILYPMQKQINAVLLLAALVLGGFLAYDPSLWYLPLLVIGLATVLGVTSVIPIGGADMPVVISLMNSYSGLAGAMAGFALGNNV